MSETTRRINPLMAAAAIAVILFSAVGVGVMTGLIPSSSSSSPDAITSSDRPTTAAPSSKRTDSRPAKVAGADSRPAKVAAADPTPAQPAAAACIDCGVVASVNAVAVKGEGSGLGAAGGAVVGGLVGNQVGSGRGNTAATVVGAVGGAMVGNEVEKRVKSSTHYNVEVRMDSGPMRTFTFASAPGYTVGEKVKVVDGKLVKA